MIIIYSSGRRLPTLYTVYYHDDDHARFVNKIYIDNIISGEVFSPKHAFFLTLIDISIIIIIVDNRWTSSHVCAIYIKP